MRGGSLRLVARALWVAGGAALVIVVLAWLGGGSWFSPSAASLRDEPVTALFDPGSGPGVRLRFDAADARAIAHTDWLRSHGASNLTLRDTDYTGLGPRGTVLRLQLSWPSLHVPAVAACPGDRGLLTEDCPVLTIYLESAIRWKDVDRLAPGQVWQWTAFRTRGWRSQEWAGWNCDPRRSQEMNQRILAPNAAADQWAVPPDLLQGQCAPAPGRLARTWPRLAGWQEHEVLWSCPVAADRNAEPGQDVCLASFLHAGRLVTLRVPGRAWSGQPDASLPAAHALRPRLVEAAWRTLEEARRAAGGSPPAQDREALRRELAWCEGLVARSSSMRRAGKEDQVIEAWGSSGWQFASAGREGPCGRAFHRVLGESLRLPAGARPDPELVQAARRLGELELESFKAPSQALDALGADLITREQGPRSLAALEWRARRGIAPAQIEQTLALYESQRQAVARLPAARRLAVRRAMSLVDTPVHDTLEWEFARDWLTARDALPLPGEAVYALLLRTASSARLKPPAEAQARLAVLLPAMRDELRRMEAAHDLPARDRAMLIARMALHAAWHAHWMALQDAQSATWLPWLDEHAAWTASTLPPWQAAWLTGVRLHRDAARAGRLLQPDCPGGIALGCDWAVPSSAPGDSERLRNAWQLMLAADGGPTPEGLARGAEWVEAKPRDLPNQRRGETLDLFHYRCAGRPGSNAARDPHWVRCVQGTRICSDPGDLGAYPVFLPLDELVTQQCRRMYPGAPASGRAG